VFFDPDLLWDVGFQLSFAATLGLVVIGNPLLRWFTSWLEKRMPSEKARKVADPVGEYLLLTLAAQAATLPLMAWHFHQVSLTSVIANPLIFPAQPLIMMLGAVALLVGIIFLPLGHILGWFVLPLLSYTTGVVEWLARLSGSIQITGSSLVWIFILLAAAALVLLIGKRFPYQLKPAILLTASGLAGVVIWMAVAMRPDGNLHITLLALDEGHAILIRTPHGQTYLLNGAASGRNLAAVLDHRLSPFDRDLEGLILTEPQSTPINGLNFLAEQMGVEQVIWGVNVPANATTRRLENLLHQAGTLSRILEDGQVFQLEPGLFIEVRKSDEEGTARFYEMVIFLCLSRVGSHRVPYRV
jgi:competence protein ComEC